MRRVNQLNHAMVIRLKEPGRYPDGLGLILQINPKGAKSWLFRFARGGRERWMGLGPVHSVSLAEAREAAYQARRVLLAGADPLEARRASKAITAVAAAKNITFGECAQRYLIAHAPAWSARHRHEVETMLITYAIPVIGPLPVDAVDTPLVMQILEPLWAEKADRGSRVRNRIEAVLDWASAGGFRSGDNPARWRGHLDHLLAPPRKIARVKHMEALPYRELPIFVTAVRSVDSIAARALEFTILTAARSGEATGALWAEMDLKQAVWVVRGERMKGGKEHRVPLSGAALKLLKDLPRTGEYVFQSAAVLGRPTGAQTLRAVLRDLGRAVTVHGFRSTFRDWAAEQTAYPAEVAEMALAHSVGSAVEKAYRRTDLFEKRRRLMDDWAAMCASAARGEVVGIRGRG